MQLCVVEQGYNKKDTSFKDNKLIIVQSFKTTTLRIIGNYFKLGIKINFNDLTLKYWLNGNY